MRVRNLLLVSALIIIAGGMYFGSLFLSLHELESGFSNRDVVKLEKYVNWPRVRGQLREELHAASTKYLINEAVREQNQSAGFLGSLIIGAIAPSVLDRVLDDLITARGFVRMLSDATASAQQFTKTNSGLTDIDEYTFTFKKAGDDAEFKIVLERDRLTWRVVNVILPPGGAPWDDHTAVAGLEVTVKPTRTADSVVITGDIVNSAQVTRRIPRLRVSLRDGNKTELDARIIDPPVTSLAPGATARFDTTFEHPSITATGVAVTFSSQ